MHPCTVLTNRLTYFASTLAEYSPHYPKVEGLTPALSVEVEKKKMEE
jgi:hypothetical protein